MSSEGDQDDGPDRMGGEGPGGGGMPDPMEPHVVDAARFAGDGDTVPSDGRPWLLMPGTPPVFPDPRAFDEGGLLAAGGDLSVPRLLAAYRAGIFPWYDEHTPILWWSPDPRCHITRDSLHVSRSLGRSVRRAGFTFSLNRDFAAVIQGCGEGRSDGTWLTGEMVEAYTALHRQGHAHSFECWTPDGRLAGGLYGVQAGGLFAAESKFHRVTDASKAVLVVAVQSLFRMGIRIFDVQFLTDHLATMGAAEWSRSDYLDAVTGARDLAVTVAGDVGWES